MKLGPFPLSAGLHLLVFLALAGADALVGGPDPSPIHVRLRRPLPPPPRCCGETFTSTHCPAPEPVEIPEPWISTRPRPEDPWESFRRRPEERRWIVRPR